MSDPCRCIIFSKCTRNKPVEKMNGGLLDKIIRLKAIVNIGLQYSNDDYEKERYHELEEISFDLLHAISGHSTDTLKEYFPLVKDYPTAKVDIRGLLCSPDQKVLLVREKSDNKWSLPGGWADIGYSPKEVVIKEFKEETGLDIIPKKLLAVFDKKMHPHPPQPLYAYKMVFYCEAVSFRIDGGFEVLDVQYFDINALPELSNERILKSQIEFVYQKVMTSDFETYFD